MTLNMDDLMLEIIEDGTDKTTVLASLLVVEPGTWVLEPLVGWVEFPGRLTDDVGTLTAFEMLLRVELWPCTRDDAVLRIAEAVIDNPEGN